MTEQMARHAIPSNRSAYEESKLRVKDRAGGSWLSGPQTLRSA